MVRRRIRKHVRKVIPIKRPQIKEDLYTKKGNIPLNIAQTDRISFSVLRNNKKRIRKIENISYEINIEGKWEWVVRYDDHGGQGSLHRHFRISLKDNRDVESSIGVKTLRNKGDQLTWVCKDIKNNYLALREEFLKNIGLDIY